MWWVATGTWDFVVVCLSELMSETYSCMQARLMLTWFILFFLFLLFYLERDNLICFHMLFFFPSTLAFYVWCSKHPFVQIISVEDNISGDQRLNDEKADACQPPMLHHTRSVLTPRSCVKTLSSRQMCGPCYCKGEHVQRLVMVLVKNETN